MGGLLGWASSDAEIGARLVLSGRPQFSADAKKATADVEELGAATEQAGAKAKAAGPGFDTAGKKVAAAGVKAKTAGTFFTNAGNKFMAAGTKMQAAGKKLTHVVTLPVLALGAASIKGATDFNTSMTRIQTQAGASAKDVAYLSKQVLGMKNVQQGPNQLAASLYHLKSVGMDNVSAMKALRQASNLSAVSGADLEDTTNALAGAWRTGIRGATSFKQTVSSLNAIVGAGNMKMSDLNSALGTGILPSAKTFGLTLKDVGSALALFTDEGVPATAAATRLRMTFSLMGAPVPKAIKELKSIGITQYQLANDMRKKNGLVVAVGDLKTHLDASGLSATKQAALLSRAFGGGRSSSTILSMLNNYDVLAQKQKQVSAGMKRFGADTAKQLQTPQAKFKLLIASLEQLGVKIGNQLLPYVVKLAQKLSSVLDWFDKLSPSTKKWIGYGILLAATLGPVLSIGGKVVKMIGLMSKAIGFLIANPWVAVILLVVVALVLAYTKFKWFRDFVQTVWKDLQIAAKATWRMMEKVWKTYGQPMLELAIAIFKIWWATSKPILNGMWKLWQLTWKLIKPILTMLINIIKRVARFYLSVLTVAGRVARGIAHGLDYMRTHWDGFLSFMKKVPGKIGGFFKGLGSIIISPFKWAFNEIATGWNNTVGKLSFKAPKWVPFIGGKGWSVPDMPTWKEHGGAVSAGKSYYVGEKGVELFQPSVSGVIVPNYTLKAAVSKESGAKARAARAPVGSAFQRQYDGRIDTSKVTGGTDTPIVIQLKLDSKVLAEAVYKKTQDKVARQ